jgi:hypothetical protein
VDKDDNGWHPKIETSYYLSMVRVREDLPQHDIEKASSTLEIGIGDVFKDDFHDSQSCDGIKLLEALGILDLLTPGISYTNNSPQMIEIEQKVKKDKVIIENCLGAYIGEKMTPVAIAQALLAKLGEKLTFQRKVGGKGKQVRVYSYVPVGDVSMEKTYVLKKNKVRRRYRYKKVEYTNSKIEKELLERELESIPVIGKPRTMKIQADIKEKMEICCAANKITLDTLVEGMFAVLCEYELSNIQLSEKVIARAKVGKANRDRSREIKTILTKITDID